MASLGPIGNAIYTNQQMATVASDKNAQQNRFDLQNVAAAAAANDKEEEVQEVRPTEENHMVDPDREHAKQEAEEEMSEQGKEHEDEEKEVPKPKPRLHLLDIKV